MGRTVLARPQKTERFEDTLCFEVHLNLGLAQVVFLSLFHSQK